MKENKNTGYLESTLPITSINDLPQANSLFQNSHNNEEFVIVNTMENCDDQFKNNPLITSKNWKNSGGIVCCVPVCYSN